MSSSETVEHAALCSASYCVPSGQSLWTIVFELAISSFSSKGQPDRQASFAGQHIHGACYHVRRIDHVSAVDHLAFVRAPGIGIGISWPPLRSCR